MFTCSIRKEEKCTISYTHIPNNYVKEYEEAYAVITDSPKTNAALGRRLLQQLLEDKGNVKKGSHLIDEIQYVINSHQLPQYLVDPIDDIRKIGNLGAHPMKRTSTGQIIDVEPGEAEHNLHVLEYRSAFISFSLRRLKQCAMLCSRS